MAQYQYFDLFQAMKKQIQKCQVHNDENAFLNFVSLIDNMSENSSNENLKK